MSNRLGEERLYRLRNVIRVLIREGKIREYGMQTQIAKVYGISRQRVSQLVREEEDIHDRTVVAYGS